MEDYDAESFLDLVLREFGYEFQVEAKRWMQLKRTERAAEVIKETLGRYPGSSLPVSDTPG